MENNQSQLLTEEDFEKLKQRGVLVRHFSQNRISDYVRITIGSVEEMNILVENIKEILEESL